MDRVASRWTSIPFAPRRWPFFYGWVIVAVGTVGVLASIPGQTVGVGVFADDLIKSLGLNRVWLSRAYMFGTIGSSLMLPFAGWMLDRIGARAMAVLSTVGLGISVAILSVSDRLAHYNGAQSVTLATGVAFVCFMLIRFFGQGCLTMTSRVMIGKWFNHRRGLATAVSGVFVAFGFNGAPDVLNRLVQALGWREACWVLAALVGVGMTVLGWIFYRDNPEECGLVMDGVHDPAWQRKMAARVPETRKEFTRPEALRTLAFWAFSLGVASQGLIITAVIFHAASIGETMGLSREASFAVFLPMSFFGIPSNMLAGWLADRIKLKWLLLAMMVGQAAGTMGLLTLCDWPGWLLFVVGFGVCGGLFATLTTVVWPRFFGRKHLGEITGLNMSIMVFASAIGPALFAQVQAWTGSYLEVILGWSLVPIVLLIVAMVAENPQERLVATEVGFDPVEPVVVPDEVGDE